MKKKSIEKYKKMINEAVNDLKTPGRRYRQIPNILTALRLFAPLIIIPTALTGNISLTIAEAAIFGLTDFADGQIARKCKLQSDLGATLDALSDKIFVGTLLIASSIYNPYLLVNLGLEAGIAGININAELKGKNPKSSKIGKIKTWFLFTLGILGIISPETNLEYLLPTLSSATAIMQGATLATYIEKYKNEMNSSKKQHKLLEDSKRQEELEAVCDKEKQEEKTKKEEQIEDLKEMKEFLTNQERESRIDKDKIYLKK